MAIRGRKPKPLAVRKLEGNPGKRPLVKRGANSRVEKGLKEIKKKAAEKKERQEQLRSQRSRRKKKKGARKGKKGLRKKEKIGKEKKEKKEIKKKEIEEKGKNKEKEKKGNIAQGKPLCPAWLNEKAKREWRRIAPILKQLGLLEVIDRAALAGYCQAYARWREAEGDIQKNGMTYMSEKGNHVPYPQVGIAQKYLQICKNFLIEFGMTPSSRGRLTLPGGEDGDELDDFLD